MISKSFLAPLVLATAIVVAGCVGKSFDRTAILKVKVGMTEAEVESLAGPPLWKRPFTKDPTVVTWGWYSDNMVRVDRAQIVFKDGVVIQAPSGVTRSSAETAEQGRQSRQELRHKLDNDRRNAFLEAHPEIVDPVRSAVLNGRIRLGMTSDAVVASWGEPQRRNRTVTAGGVTEQWVYPASTYVYLNDGVVTSWQDSR